MAGDISKEGLEAIGRDGCALPTLSPVAPRSGETMKEYVIPADAMNEFLSRLSPKERLPGIRLTPSAQIVAGSLSAEVETLRAANAKLLAVAKAAKLALGVAEIMAGRCEPKIGDWNWPQIASELRVPLADAAPLMEETT